MQKKIIVVDDDMMNLRMAEFILKQNGYMVEKAESGEECFALLAEENADLILLDIEMPEMNGFEVIERLQQNKKWCKIPVIFLTADRTEETEEKCFKMGAVDYIGKPFVPAIMIQRIRRTMELESYRKSLEVMVEKQLQRITQLQHEIIITMANLIESRDGTTGGHIKRTSEYTEFFVDKIKERGLYTDIIDSNFKRYIRKAAPMHDIGKITIPDAILQKPGALTKEEYEIMKSHAEAGGRIIEENMGRIVDHDFVEVARNMAAYHHEKWNGTGYPKGLKGEEIPLCARILAITDVFDALVSKRQYKEGMSIEKAFEIMQKERGIGFEPALLDIFIEEKEALSRLMEKLN